MSNEYKYGEGLKNRTLAEGVQNLWIIHDELCSVFRELEDEERVLSYSGIARKFSKAMEIVNDLICCIEDADRFMKRQRRKTAK